MRLFKSDSRAVATVAEDVADLAMAKVAQALFKGWNCVELVRCAISLDHEAWEGASLLVFFRPSGGDCGGDDFGVVCGGECCLHIVC